jgi:WYL domain
VVLTLNVSDDYALRSWILGFGRYVRVLAPDALAQSISGELHAAREQYDADGRARYRDSDTQPQLEAIGFVDVEAPTLLAARQRSSGMSTTLAVSGTERRSRSRTDSSDR